MSKRKTILDASVILEACPPTLEDRDKAYAVLRQSFSCYNSFHAVSVPDLQDEGEFRRMLHDSPNVAVKILLGTAERLLESEPAPTY